MNTNPTSQECVAHLMRKVDGYRDRGTCLMCAVALAASDYDLDPTRVENLYFDHLLANPDVPED